MLTRAQMDPVEIIKRKPGRPCTLTPTERRLRQADRNRVYRETHRLQIQNYNHTYYVTTK